MIVTKFSLAGPLLLIVIGSLMYHIAAKSVPQSLEPFGALVGVYATALVACLVAYAAVRHGVPPPQLSSVWHPTIAAVGLGALMIELGFLLTYRAAWPVSTASVLSNGLVAVLLIPTGALLFGEAITAVRVTGVILCLLGVWLLQR